jgi:hypothetical protein
MPVACLMDTPNQVEQAALVLKIARCHRLAKDVDVPTTLLIMALAVEYEQQLIILRGII